ncbi:MAG: hypothetical protein ACXWM7_02985, partial [Parachlamydiaceae bacterium]
MTIPIVSYSDERLYGEIFEWPGKSVAAFVFAYDHLESTPSTLFEKIRSLAGSIILGIVFSISIHTLLGPLFLLGRFIKICHYHCLPMLAKIQEIVQSYWNLQQPSESDKAAELAKILKNDLSDQNLR